MGQAIAAGEAVNSHSRLRYDEKSNHFTKSKFSEMVSDLNFLNC